MLRGLTVTVIVILAGLAAAVAFNGIEVGSIDIAGHVAAVEAGGFEDSEIQMALDAGIEPVTMGRRILRTETAGFTMLAWIMYQLEGAEAEQSGTEPES